MIKKEKGCNNLRSLPLWDQHPFHFSIKNIKKFKKVENSG